MPVNDLKETSPEEIINNFEKTKDNTNSNVVRILFNRENIFAVISQYLNPPSPADTLEEIWEFRLIHKQSLKQDHDLIENAA